MRYSFSRLLFLVLAFLPSFLTQSEFLAFPSPETLTFEEIREGINLRKDIWEQHVFTNLPPSFNLVPLYLQHNISFDFDAIVQPELDVLEFKQDPDFKLMTLIRILYMTDEFNVPILEAIQKIKLWLTIGENLRIYWTENHQIMYTVAAFLLRQKFGEEFFEPDFFDQHLDARLDWILTTKPETGFFEFNSPIYFHFSATGLLLLHDFAENATIKDAALRCLHKGIEEWMTVTSSEGLVSQAAGRSYNAFYFSGERLERNNGAQQIVSFLTGLGPLIDGRLSVRAIIPALILTNADFTPAVATYKPKLFEVRQVGLGPNERDAVFSLLPGFERHLAQITMGLYASEAVVNDLNDFLRFYQIGGREDFGPFGALQLIANDEGRVTLARVLESIALGSTYYVPEFVTYKDNNVVMTSCNDYFPGVKGYQQFPNMAVIHNTTVFTFAMEEDLFLDPETRSQLLGNNQIPYLKQKENVLLAIYNPRRDLGTFGVDNLDVMFYFNSSLFDEVKEEGRWVFGRVSSAFVGVYREQCRTSMQGHVVTVCAEEVQIWITVVGTIESHGSFEQFRLRLMQSEFDLDRSVNCGRAVGTIDEQLFNDTFCQGDFDIVEVDINDEEDLLDDDFGSLVLYIGAGFGGTFLLFSVVIIVKRMFKMRRNDEEDEVIENNEVNAAI